MRKRRRKKGTWKGCWKQRPTCHQNKNSKQDSDLYQQQKEVEPLSERQSVWNKKHMQASIQGDYQIPEDDSQRQRTKLPAKRESKKFLREERQDKSRLLCRAILV